MDWFHSIFKPLYYAVSWIIVQFHSLFGSIFDPDGGLAWGLSIVFLVVVIRAALIPLFVKQIKATRGMQALQPKMKVIQERYKNDKQRQSEEMMKLYKEHGTNPFSSCLPILVQSPFFIALYQVLSHIAQGKKVGVINGDLLSSAQDAHIFGAPLAAKFMDSAAKAAELDASLTNIRVVTIVMIVLMSASQFFTQRQLMTKNMDRTVKTPFMSQQKVLMYVFPIMFAVFGINFPVGVLIYWLTTNVWTMCQQLVVINRNPTPGSEAQKSFLERLAKHIQHAGKTRTRHQQRSVRAVVTKSDRNPHERKFITELRKAGLSAQPDGTVITADAAEEAETVEDAPRAAGRQQPKRQSKAQRQGAAGDAGRTADAVSFDKEPDSDEPAAAPVKKAAAKQPAKRTGGKQTTAQRQAAARKAAAARKSTPAKKSAQPPEDPKKKKKKS